MNIEKYLARIGYTGPVGPDYATLSGLHRAHILTVPFENLDIHAGRKIAIGAENAYRKIVEERRGGFCYEHNGLFGAILAELGFAVTNLSGRVTRGKGVWGPEFDHLALLVEVPGDELYLVDVGFGDSFREPLRWKETGPQLDSGSKYRLEEIPEGRVMAQRLPGEDWVGMYILSVVPRNLADYSEICHFHQTSTDSPFTKGSMISLPKPNGRVTLTGQQLIVTRQGERVEQALPDRAAYFENLEQHFGVVLPPELRQVLEAKVGPASV